MTNYQRINHALRAIHMNIRCNMHAEVKRQQVDFSPLEHIAMQNIFKCSGASQQMLVEIMNKDKAQIARIVARLLRQDLIIKQESPEDKRCVLLNLSDKGEKLLKRLDEVELEVLGDMLTGFSEQESASLMVLLERINQNFK
ncbi:MarR family winged helix-turn-helix transcriptional regulator [Psychromonas sp. KJ10-10]|uniref:MarR family winged helix-turn-helix transcriptional regulator n=1 Tax=Psychromonas sp. KJ10-10 TaxID=3391823 RepID=UPI0039B45B5C